MLARRHAERDGAKGLFTGSCVREVHVVELDDGVGLGVGRGSGDGCRRASLHDETPEQKGR